MDLAIKNPIRRGINFLANDQEKDGGFMCLVTAKFDNYEKEHALKVPAIVPPNIVLSSLSHLPETKAIKNIKDKTAKFLLKERGEFWSFNYWFKKSKEFTDIPYPDDLDDTFCALAALYEYDPKIFSGDVMGKIITMLTAAEIEEGGPYNMWLTPKDNIKWRDIDLVVNSNIGFFLKLNGVEMPKLNAFIEKSINEADYEFPYNTIYPGIYFISRFYKGEGVHKMLKLLEKKKDKQGKWENPLRTALAVSSIMNISGREDRKLHKEAERGIQYILKTQNKDGSWPAYSFFYQMRLPEKTLYAGSASTTTALCLEALNKWSMYKEKFENKEKNTDIFSGKAKDIYIDIAEKITKRFSGLSKEIRETGLQLLSKTLDGDQRKEIPLLPCLFAESLDKNTSIPEEILADLGLANLYGWIAYDIYDDFLDSEGDPKFLPVGSLCFRECTRIFEQILPTHAGFAEFARSILDKIEEANAWEIENCRITDTEKYLKDRKRKLPKYTNYFLLAQKSLGHALGPIGVLFARGYGKNSKEVKNTLEFFAHYLAARQLSDDAHDWQEDLKKGQLNGASALLLEEFAGKTADWENLEKVFWEKTINKIAEIIFAKTKKAETLLTQLKYIKDKSFLASLLEPAREAMHKALKEQKETKKFLRSYKNK